MGDTLTTRQGTLRRAYLTHVDDAWSLAGVPQITDAALATLRRNPWLTSRRYWRAHVSHPWVEAPPPTTLRTGLVSYWGLNEAQASDTRLDSHGSNHLAPVSDPAPSLSPKLGARALLCTADPQYLRRTSPSGLQGGNRDFTLAGWVWLNGGAAGEQVIVGRWSFPADDRDYLLEWQDGTLAWIVRTADNSANVVASRAWDTRSTWTWLACWHDAGSDELGLQVNGEPPTTQAIVGGTRAAVSVAFDLGGNTAAAGLGWQGALDDWGFWARVLTSGERAQLYNGGAGLAYPFGEA
jgi:hypothetical protein